jgi:hypothetical protein
LKPLPPETRRTLFIAAILLACFLGIDRFLVRAGSGSFQRASGAFRSVETRLFHARSEVEQLKRMRALLGTLPPETGGASGTGAIAFLNKHLSQRQLQKVDLRSESNPAGGRGEPYQLTVQGGYASCVQFLGDLEASRERIWLRDVRISLPTEGAGLEMRVRLEFERPQA